MAAVLIGIVSLLAWAIASDRKSYRTAGGKLPRAVAPLHRNLEMPHDLKTHGGRSHAPRSRRNVTGSSVA